MKQSCKRLLFFFLWGGRVLLFSLEHPENKTPEIRKTPETSKSAKPSSGDSSLSSPRSAEGRKGVSAKADQNNPDFARQFLKQDIETSSPGELKLWVRKLNLTPAKDPAALKKQLYQFYRLENPVRAPGRSSSFITLIRGEKGISFELRPKEESYLTLKGDLLVSLEDRRKNRHYIRTQKLIFNRDKDLITAEGGVRYLLNPEGPVRNREEFNRIFEDSRKAEQIFEGEKINFSFKGWKGLIFKGTTYRSQKIPGLSGEETGEETEFLFRGDEIKKGEDGSAIFRKASITSDGQKDPYYRISARKIWILGEGEWGILSAVPRLGHIPFFWLPLFYRSEDSLFFNPVVGLHSREGFFINTTTYFWGRKKRQKQFLSFMGGSGNSEDGSEAGREIKTEWNGLFLSPVREESDEPKTEQKQKKLSGYLKYMLDAYANLGFFTGLEGSLSGETFVKELRGFLGIGFSRSINGQNNPYYSLGGTGEIRSRWNTSYFPGKNLPFRWGGLLKMKTDFFTLDFTAYADPFFYDDFRAKREENFDLITALLKNSVQDQWSPNGTDNSTGLDSLLWELRSDYDFSPDLTILNPYLEHLSLDEFKVSVDWGSKENTGAASRDPYAPDRRFFYPSQFYFPLFRASAGGTLFSFSGDNPLSREEGVPKNRETGFLPPPEAAAPENIERPSPENGKGLLPPPELPESQKQKLFSFDRNNFSGSFGYEYRTNFNIGNTSESSSWNSPRDIGLSPETAKVNWANQLNLPFRADFFDRMISLTNTLRLDSLYINPLARSAISAQTLPAVLRRDYNLYRLNIGNELTVRLHPFKFVPWLRESSLLYTLNFDWYRRRFESLDADRKPSFRNIWFFEDGENIGTHRLQADFSLTPPLFGMRFNLFSEFILPPASAAVFLNPSFSVKFFPWWLNEFSSSFRFNAALKGSGASPLSAWSFDPLRWNSEIRPVSWFFLGNEFLYAYRNADGDSAVEENRTKLSLFDLQAEFLLRYTPRLQWDSQTLQWLPKEKALIPAELTLRYQKEWEIPPFWKNRIRLSFPIQAAFQADLNRLNQMSFSLNLGFSLKIYQVLEASLAISSLNDKLFLYFPEIREKLGIKKEYNFFEDLFKSFNFIKTQDRIDSFFNLQSLVFKLKIRFPDWTLQSSLTGRIQSVNNRSQWVPSFSFFIGWKPIPEIKIKADYRGDRETWDIRSR